MSQEAIWSSCTHVHAHLTRAHILVHTPDHTTSYPTHTHTQRAHLTCAHTFTYKRSRHSTHTCTHPHMHTSQTHTRTGPLHLNQLMTKPQLIGTSCPQHTRIWEQRLVTTPAATLERPDVHAGPRRQGRGGGARGLTARAVPPARHLGEQQAEPPGRTPADSPCGALHSRTRVQPHPAFSLNTPARHVSTPPRAGSLWQDGAPQRCFLHCPGWTTARHPRGRGQNQTLPCLAAVPFPKRLVNT